MPSLGIFTRFWVRANSQDASVKQEQIFGIDSSHAIK
jgi:hypothetical protein